MMLVSQSRASERNGLSSWKKELLVREDIPMKGERDKMVPQNFISRSKLKGMMLKSGRAKREKMRRYPIWRTLLLLRKDVERSSPRER